MRVLRLRKDPAVYSSEVYLIRGDWNHLSDVNTLVDVGANGAVVSELLSLATGVGKRAVQQVVLTHSHFDHSGGLDRIAEEFDPEVWAYSHHNPRCKRVRDGQSMHLGDRDFYVIYSPGHSNDSICLYGPDDGVLFSGDTELNLMMPGGSYSRSFVRTLETLVALPLKTIFPGHGDPLVEGVGDMLRRSLDNVYRSEIFDDRAATSTGGDISAGGSDLDAPDRSASWPPGVARDRHFHAR